MASSFAIGGASELVRVAVTLILKDEGFGLPSTPASSARVTAEKLLEWSSQQENKPVCMGGVCRATGERPQPLL